jgi:integrase
MASILFHKTGGWFIAFRERGNRKLIREYFGKTEEGKRNAEVRLAEVKFKKLKGEELVDRSGMYLDQLAQLYLEDAKARGKTLRWRTEFASRLNADILPNLSSKPVDKLTYADILALTGKGGAWETKSMVTAGRYLGYLRAVFQFGIDKKFTRNTPFTDWTRPKDTKRKPDLTIEALQKIISHAQPHLAWALQVEWYLGTRPGPSELFGVRWSDVNFDNMMIHVRGTKTEESDRYVPVPAEFIARLREAKMLAASDYVVEYRGHPVRQMRRSFKAACQAAGIKFDIRPYDVRHLFATVMLNKGADLAAVSKILGHSRIETTMERYYHLMEGEKARAVSLLPPMTAPVQPVGAKKRQRRVEPVVEPFVSSGGRKCLNVVPLVAKRTMIPADRQ